MKYLLITLYLGFGLGLFFLWYRELYRWNQDIEKRKKELKERQERLKNRKLT